MVEFSLTMKEGEIQHLNVRATEKVPGYFTLLHLRSKPGVKPILERLCSFLCDNMYKSPLHVASVST
jgi:hypothetical protein